ncbi:S8 family peptidase [Botrimarina mediterranea]|uniref:Peptidase S8/S53 domain-containing protein n=1 Tax=Botrimarina mediterranea TaxID=2528022 RepID=A0A518K7A9_9BACT|nr:S8 family peptidase [Botrimarina mediterranea]QDV73647.1 hypothetical protein Spa11_18460 [Botrimarina mediterranea]QDV78237.1 hypothetical protein K2D_18440 [Planctomycetes bacterium K2D]
MDPLRHLFPSVRDAAESYQYPHDVRGSGSFDVPPRDRVPHAEALTLQVEAAENAASSQPVQEGEAAPEGLVLDFRGDPGFKLKLDSLEFRQSGIELRSARTDATGVMHASVFVPHGKTGYFVKRFEQYAREETKKGRPKNQELVESITEIRLATLESFWRDAGEMPSADEPVWWEIWLSDTGRDGEVVGLFRQRAAAQEVAVTDRDLAFPERRVVLAKATRLQLSAIENLFDMLAELRLAKLLPGEFIDLGPTGQGEFVEEAVTRVTVTPPSASVCHLDTGVNRGHPLLEVAIGSQHVLSADPAWSPADPKGHGTEMAGLALYGCLTGLLGSQEPMTLRHCVESVKIMPDGAANDPDLWGSLTIQAAARIEIAAPQRSQRAFSLTVTAEARDDGAPSSWSAAVDQMCAAVDEEAPGRLVLVAAGNLPLELRHEHPNRNLVEGVEDPGQSWNALTVGAFTELVSVRQSAYSGWRPVASRSGELSPASRTSRIWSSRSWPIKPDLLMEGGNVAIDPATGRADFIDDLSLLTTRVHASGAQLTTTGDTSAATALASRFAARLWAEYPSLRAETVRALMVHSARWTEPMLEFADGNKETLLRCCGYGAPDFGRACWSAANAATMVIESSLQPFRKKVTSGAENKRSVSYTSHQMDVHRLPWPTEVLRGLVDAEVRMRVTLSYFIEPSPGRRGWTRKHRYQSHGLRFEVKRPEETLDRFRKRVSKAARDEDEQVDGGGDDREWSIGKQLRCKGSVHSDMWRGTAAQLAASGVIAVYPVTGWWKERPHLNRFDKRASYSLVVSIETDAVDVDLYTPIVNQVAVSIDGYGGP